MENSIPPQNTDREAVPVSIHGEITIPKQFREKLEIDGPGRVLFQATEDGDVIIEQVRSPSDMRGFVTREGARTEKSATEILQGKREQDRIERDSQFETGE